VTNQEAEPRCRGGILEGSSILEHLCDECLNEGRVGSPVSTFSEQKTDRVLDAEAGHAGRVGNFQDQVVRGTSGEGPNGSVKIGEEAVQGFVKVVKGEGEQEARPIGG
jgi:hypothetical protein